MAASMILGRFDLLDPTSPVKLLVSGYDRSGAVPTTSEIQSTVLDGAVVTGDASANRSPTLSIKVIALDTMTRVSLANEVMRVVNAASWTLTFTPDGGAPVIYDCFRGRVEPISVMPEEDGGQSRFTVTCEALPFGKSPTQVSFDLVSTGVVVEQFDTLPTITGTVESAAIDPNGAGGIDGPYLVLHLADASYYQAGYHYATGPVTLSRSVSTPVPSGVTDASIDVYGVLNLSPPVFPSAMWSLTLTVDGIDYTATSGDPVTYETWQPVSFRFAQPIPAGTITAWSLSIPSFPSPTNVYNGTTYYNILYIDVLSTSAGSTAGVSTAHGSQLAIPAVIGTARTPIGVQLARKDASAFSSWVVHTPPAGSVAQALVPASGTSINATVPAAQFGGTYSVWIPTVAGSVNPDRPGTVTVTQSNSAASVALPYTIPMNTSGVPLPVMIYAGEVSLPLAAVPGNSNATITFTAPAVSAAAVAYQDVLLLDTRGRTVLVDGAPAEPFAWITEAPSGQLFGEVYSGANPQSSASVQAHMPVGASLILSPGESRILLYGLDGPLTATLTYAPRWLQDADWPTP